MCNQTMDEIETLLDDLQEQYDAAYQAGNMEQAAHLEYRMCDLEEKLADLEEDAYEFNDDDGLDAVQADADVLRSAGWGTDEDYGYQGDDFDY